MKLNKKMIESKDNLRTGGGIRSHAPMDLGKRFWRNKNGVRVILTPKLCYGFALRENVLHQPVYRLSNLAANWSRPSVVFGSTTKLASKYC